MTSFEADIKALFREEDQRTMRFAFDLWDYDDVCDNAESILARLEDGSMPCDTPWEDDQLELFRSWVDEGMDP